MGNTRITYSPMGTNGDLFVNQLDAAIDYFPYGKILRQYQFDDERYLTTQHERDKESGLDYRGARFYDADVARFLSTDPWQAKYPEWSTYNYVMGNPIVFVDPTGKGVTGDYYDKQGNYLGSDDQNDKKVWVASGKDEKGNYKNRSELNITNEDFKFAAGVIKSEASGETAEESLGIAHALNNRTKQTKNSFVQQLQDYSSVKNKVALSNSDKSNGAKYARSGLIDVLLGGFDLVKGATHWDGRDLLAAQALGSYHSKSDGQYLGYKGLAYEPGNSWAAMYLNEWQRAVINYYTNNPYYKDKDKNDEFIGKLNLNVVNPTTARWFIVTSKGQTLFIRPCDALD